MTESDKKIVLDRYELNPSEFTCEYCKEALLSPDCEGCPLKHVF